MAEKKADKKADKNEHATVFDYLTWRGDLTFAQDGFNEVDNLILCIISYINFKKISRLWSTDPAEAMLMSEVCPLLTQEDEQLGLSDEDYIPLMRAAAQTKRFSEVKLFAYESRRDDVQEMQFNAVSFLLPDNSVFVAYMGTDRSFAGWKEDFNMSFLEAVPAQVRATEYAMEIAAVCPDRTLRIGGHSKGGNLAAWAAVHIPEKLQNRMAAAYNNDGPGFSKGFLEREEYKRVEDKIHTYIPESSIVGVLLEHAEDYAVIDSNNRAVMQHEPLSWGVLGAKFVHLGQRSQLGQLSDGVLQDWIGSLSAEEREEFSEAIFEILSISGKVHTLDDLREGGLAGGAALLKGYIGADEKKKRIITEVFHRLAVDIKEEVMRSAEEGIKSATQVFSDLRK